MSALRPGRLLLPAGLITVGIVALLANGGLIGPAALSRLAGMWPLILVVIGAQLVLDRALPPARASLAGLLVLALAVAGALAYSVEGPAGGGATVTGQGTGPAVGSISRATLAVDGGGFRVSLHTGGTGDALYQYDYGAPDVAPRVTEGTGGLEVSFGSEPGLRLFGGGGERFINVHLNGEVAWTIKLNGGGINAGGDLGAAKLGGIDVAGGANHVDLALGRPSGTVPLQFTGGALNITLRLVDGTPVKVDAAGGANRASVGGHSLGGLGDLTYSSAGYDSATDRYDISLAGGASSLDVNGAA